MASKFDSKYDSYDSDDDDEILLASEQVSTSPLTDFAIAMSQAGPEIASLRISLSENVSKSSFTDFDSFKAGPEIVTVSTNWSAMYPPSPIQAPTQDTHREAGPELASLRKSLSEIGSKSPVADYDFYQAGPEIASTSTSRSSSRSPPPLPKQAPRQETITGQSLNNQNRYEEIILEKFASLPLQYVHRIHTQSFFQDVEQECRRHRISLPPEDDTFVLHMQQVCDILWSAVKSIEDDFDKFIWFSDDEMPKRFIAFQTLPAWKKLIPTKIVTALINKLAAFSQEYKLRNSENKKVLERQLEEAAVKSVEDYNQKMSERVIESVDELPRIDKTPYAGVMESYPYFPNNSPAIPGKKLVTGRMPLILDHTSTPPTKTLVVQRESKPAQRNSTERAIDDNHKRYEEFVLEKFAELQLEYVHRKHCNEFFLDIQKDCRKHNIDPLANDDTFTVDMKLMCNLLWKAVAEVEEDFDKNICFPSDKMRKIIRNFRDVQNSDLPIKMGTALRNKLRTFSDEYTLRNEEIQKQEKILAEMLIEESKGFYIEQTLLKLGGRYLDRQDLTRIEEECRADVVPTFVKALGIKSTHWQTYYTNRLKLTLGCLDEIWKKNDENKKLLERQLDDAAKNAVKVYNHNMSLCVIESFEDLGKIDKTTYAGVMDSYKIRVQEITRDQSKILNDSRLRIFTKVLDDASTIFRRNFQAQIKEKEVERQAEMDRQAREQRNRQDAAQARYGEPTPRSSYSSHSGQQEVTSQNLSTSFRCAIVNVGINQTSFTSYDAHTNLIGSYFVKSNDDWFKGQLIEFQSKTFLRSMLDEPIDKLYLVTREKVTFRWTLMDFIIVLFKKVKRLLKKIAGNINYCVVVLPQCLNIKQQQCFRVGAEIVGFTRVDILTDTHVIALKFFTDNWKYSKRNVIAVHVSGNIIDAALFFQTDKSLLCQAVAGDFFRVGTNKHYVKRIVWNIAEFGNKERINSIFNPMIATEKLTKDTLLLMFGDPRNCDDIARIVQEIVPFGKVTMAIDSLIVGACIFARLVLQNDQTGLVQTVLNETKKQNAHVHNLALGEIPSPNNSALQKS